MKTKKTLLTVLSMVMMLGFLSSCKDDNKEKPDPTPEPESVELKGAISDARVLNAENEYFLAGALEIKSGGSLTIPAGTKIKARKGFDNYILVEQGGKIYIKGTAEKPVKIVPDNEQPNQAGYWGGLVINGYAPITNGNTNNTEIDPSKPYGGNNPADNSGEITYLVLDGTGARSSANIEHNGLTLNAVGNGTKIENLYIPYAADDGIEFFGGTVNVTNLLVVNADDDMFDFTEGYSGIVKNAYGIWEQGHISTESDPRGIEADGNHDGNSPAGTPQSDFEIHNITFDLRAISSETEGHYIHDVMKIRRGAKATITNALITGQGKAKDVIDLTDGKGVGNPATKITYTNKLSSTISGKEINGEIHNGNVVENDNQTGADQALYKWTAYKF